jgi:phasin family protein
MLRRSISRKAPILSPIFHQENTMNAITFEHIAAANKSALADAQAFANLAFAGFEKLAALNISAAKSTLGLAGELAHAAEAKTPADALASHAAAMRPIAEQSLSYGRSAYAIAVETSAEIARAAEARMAEGRKTLASNLDILAKNAPAGAQAAEALKSAIASSQTAFDAALASAKKASEMAEKQIASAIDAIPAAKTASRKK